MVRRIVRTAAPEAPPAPPPEKPLTPRQRSVVIDMRNGWKVMRVQTSFSSSISGSASYSWGERLIGPKGQVQKLDGRVLDGLQRRKLLESIPKPEGGPSIDDLGAFLRYQNQPRETMRLTEKGKTVAL